MIKIKTTTSLSQFTHFWQYKKTFQIQIELKKKAMLESTENFHNFSVLIRLPNTTVRTYVKINCSVGSTWRFSFHLWGEEKAKGKSKTGLEILNWTNFMLKLLLRSYRHAIWYFWKCIITGNHNFTLFRFELCLVKYLCITTLSMVEGPHQNAAML